MDIKVRSRLNRACATKEAPCALCRVGVGQGVIMGGTKRIMWRMFLLSPRPATRITVAAT